MRSSKPFLLRYCGRVFSRLNLLKSLENSLRLRPDGNEALMPNNTDLAPVGAHRRELEPFHPPCPQTVFGRFRQERNGVARAHQLGNLGETFAAESIPRRIRFL